MRPKEANVAITRDYTRPPEELPISVLEVTRALGLPGSHTVRRLEARGVLPPARRTALFKRRYWTAAELPELWRRANSYRTAR